MIHVCKLIFEADAGDNGIFQLHSSICLIIHGSVRDTHFSWNYEGFITLAKSFSESSAEIVCGTDILSNISSHQWLGFMGV